MAKKEKQSVSEETKETLKKTKFGKFSLLLVILVIGGYGVWKNPQVLQKMKSFFAVQETKDMYQVQINTLNSQMHSLQQQLALLASQIKEPDLSKVYERFDAIEKMNLNVISSKADVATVLGLVTRVDKNERKLDKLSEITDDSALVLTSLMLVKDAAEKGKPFEYEYEVLNNIVADKPKMMEKVKVLEPIAKIGVESELFLANRFNDVCDEILSADKNEEGLSWKERLNSKIHDIVQIKNTKKASEEKEIDVLEEMKKLVDDGHLMAAVSLLEASKNDLLMQNPQIIEWAEKVKTRSLFFDAINALTAQSLAVMKVNFLKKI